MKTSRLLHDLDLARIALLTTAEKRVELSKLKASWPPYGYKPFRMTILDTLNIEAGPLAPLPQTKWAAIECAIRLWGTSPEEIAANLRVAEGLYHFACGLDVAGKRQEFYPLVLSPTEKLSASYWSPIVISVDKRPVVPFFDPRKSNKLSPLGRQFALSAAHQRIRVLEHDFRDIELAVFQFSNPKVGLRVAKPYFASDIDRLVEYDELLSKVQETYAIWNEIFAEREEKRRQESRGSEGEEFRLIAPLEARRRRRT